MGLKNLFRIAGIESHVLGQMDWTSIRAPCLGNHDKLPVHEPEAAVLSSAMAGRIKSKKYPLTSNRLTIWKRLWPAFDFFFPLSSVLGCGLAFTAFGTLAGCDGVVERLAVG